VPSARVQGGLESARIEHLLTSHSASMLDAPSRPPRLRLRQEAGMSDDNRFPHQKTDIYQATMQLVMRVKDADIKHEVLKDQAERAAISTLLAIGEGLPHDGPRIRTQFFARGKASVCELVTA